MKQNLINALWFIKLRLSNDLRICLSFSFFNNNQERGTKDIKGTVKLINLKQTDNAMAKNEKKTNKQQHTRHNIEN